MIKAHRYIYMGLIFILVVLGQCKKNKTVCDFLLTASDNARIPYTQGDVMFFLDSNSVDTIQILVSEIKVVSSVTGDGCEREQLQCKFDNNILSAIYVNPHEDLIVNSLGTGIISCNVFVNENAPVFSRNVQGMSYSDLLELEPDVSCVIKKLWFSKSKGVVAYWPYDLSNPHYLLP